MSGSALLDFCERLGDSWEALADVLGIPLPDRARFQQGNEARRIVGWLSERMRLSQLEGAVEASGRADLKSVVAEIVRDAEAASTRRRVAPPRSVQQFEILFLSTESDLDYCESALQAAVEMTNIVALQATTGYRFFTNSWDPGVHANGWSHDGMGFAYATSAIATVVIVIRRNPSEPAVETLRALLETDTIRAFVVIFPDAEEHVPDTAPSLSAARNDHRDAAHWIDLPAGTEQTVALAMAAIIGRLIVDIITGSSSAPATYVEMR